MPKVKVNRPQEVPQELYPVWDGAANSLAKRDQLVTARGKVRYASVEKEYCKILNTFSGMLSNAKVGTSRKASSNQIATRRVARKASTTRDPFAVELPRKGGREAGLKEMVNKTVSGLKQLVKGIQDQPLPRLVGYSGLFSSFAGALSGNLELAAALGVPVLGILASEVVKAITALKRTERKGTEMGVTRAKRTFESVKRQIEGMKEKERARSILHGRY